MDEFHHSKRLKYEFDLYTSYLAEVDPVTENLRMIFVYLQYMEDTGRSKIRQTFWSFRGFRIK